MFVVRRSFRNYNQMIAPGSVIEPGTIKRFKSRLRDRDIIEVPEQDFDEWNAYFIAKFGTPIGPIEEKAEEPSEGEGEQLNSDMEPVVPPTEEHAEESKPVVKVVVAK